MINPLFDCQKQIPELNLPLTSLKGIGSRRAGVLAGKGLHTILDLLFFTPIRYEDRSRVLPIANTGEGPAVIVTGKVTSYREERFLRSGKRLFRIIIEDETAHLELLWFQYKKAYFNSFIRQGTELMAYGRIKKDGEMRQMIHPEVTLIEKDKMQKVLGFYPVYPAIRGISGRMLRSFVRQALDKYQGGLEDAVPTGITRRLALPGFRESVIEVHAPSKGSSLELLNQYRTKHHQRLTFDRFFGVMLNISFRKRSRMMKAGLVYSVPKDLMPRLEKYFSFTLTRDQGRAIEEVLNDLSSGRAMNRLLQGDVGCGKTVVAAVTAYISVLNNHQTAVMVPTQVLAHQHLEYFSSLPKEMGFRPVLLIGALKKSDRLRTYEKISHGECNLIIGTQALLRDNLSFNRLGLVVIDEQHRFGVRQRALLDRKGTNPHLLVMTATPIPRTLAMTVYADLDITLIKELPEGRKSVETRLISGREKRYVFNTLARKMSGGQQAIVICPVIEGSEETELKNVLEMYTKLKKIFAPRFRVGLIHGRLPPDRKDRVMDQFRSGKIDLLVGTTVIEVGIHAPRATVMVVEHPERFGLAQLHQLRGRIGRGSERGVCFLILSQHLEEEMWRRLKIFTECHDGFEIAQKDLEMRGHGELMGLRQSGVGELDYREMFREPGLLIAAKKEADRVMNADPGLSDHDNRKLKAMLELYLPRPVDW
jgi:ATP-dependent DNA helicase RecG